MRPRENRRSRVRYDTVETGHRRTRGRYRTVLGRSLQSRHCQRRGSASITDRRGPSHLLRLVLAPAGAEHGVGVDEAPGIVGDPNVQASRLGTTGRESVCGLAPEHPRYRGGGDLTVRPSRGVAQRLTGRPDEHGVDLEASIYGSGCTGGHKWPTPLGDARVCCALSCPGPIARDSADACLQPLTAASRAIVNGATAGFLRSGLTLPSGATLTDVAADRVVAVLPEPLEA